MLCSERKLDTNRGIVQERLYTVSPFYALNLLQYVLFLFFLAQNAPSFKETSATQTFNTSNINLLREPISYKLSDFLWAFSPLAVLIF